MKISSATVKGDLSLRDLDITSRIKAIEILKCALLSDVSALFERLRVPAHGNEHEESLARLLIHLYLLSKNLGTGFTELEAEACALLKREMLSDNGAAEKQALFKHIDKGRST